MVNKMLVLKIYIGSSIQGYDNVQRIVKRERALYP